jgi:ABC-2 type transport system permease protein
VAIMSQIFDHLDSMSAIHPYLISHHWLDFVDLFRSPIPWSNMAQGLVSFAIYTVLFLGAAVALMVRKDVSS